MMKKKKKKKKKDKKYFFNHLFFIFFLTSRLFIRSDVHQIIFNNRWVQEKKQQIASFGIECNIYMEMITHYHNMILVKSSSKNKTYTLVSLRMILIHCLIIIIHRTGLNNEHTFFMKF